MTTYQNELPEALRADDNLLFHGSSNISEHLLDVGSVNYDFTVNKNVVSKIIECFQGINWYGVHGGGFGILNSFSSDDWVGESKKAFFLGETFERCTLYASKDFAGGELIRSIYYALNDLRLYVADEQMRRSHEEYVTANFVYSHKAYNVDLDQLRKEVKEFESMFKKISDLRNRFGYGVVYVYKIEVADYQDLTHRGVMGINADEPLPKDKLIAKVILTDDGRRGSGNTDFRRTILWKERLGG